MLELCKSPVFDALSAEEHEIHVIGFTALQIDCFLKYLHPSFTFNMTPSSILLVAPVVHYYGVESMMKAFVQYLQENTDALLYNQKTVTLNAAVLLELLRTRTEGSCPWSKELIKAMLLERVRTMKGRSRGLDPVLWAKLKIETQMAMLEFSMRGELREELGLKEHKTFRQIGNSLCDSSDAFDKQGIRIAGGVVALRVTSQQRRPVWV